MSPRFIRFLLAGGFNTGLTYAMYLLLLQWVSYLPAYGISYVLGIVVSYVLNSRVVFHTAMSLTGMLKFPLVYLVQYAMGSVLLWLLVERLGMSRDYALLPVIIITVPLTFALTRWVLTGRSLR